MIRALSRSKRILLPILLLACLGDTALAADGPHRLRYTNLTVVRYNPLGLQNQFELDYQLRLYDPGESKILAGNYVGLSAAAVLTPAGTRLGVALKFRPLAILKLEARYEHINFFGTFDLLPSFDSPHDDFSDTAVKDNGDADNNYSTSGSQLTLDVELRARIGPIVVRNRFKAAYLDMDLKGTDDVWYDQYYDLLMPESGWALLNDADILFYATPKLIVGLRYSFGMVDYDDDAYRPGEATDADNDNHRLGPIIAYTFHDEPGTTFNRPTVLLLVNWYLKHRWRTGEDVSSGIPYLVLGFAFRGDFL